MSIDLWNVLHDGVVEHVEGQAPGDVSLRIQIGYLRELFSDGGNSVIVRLKDCQQFYYQPESPSEMLEGSIAAEELIGEWVLSAEDDAESIRVYCMNGSLYLVYGDFSVVLDNGRSITVDDLEEKSRLYWDSFGENDDSDVG